MELIREFLKKFVQLETPHKEVRERAAEVCTQVLKRPISVASIRVAGRTLFVDVPPLLKSEIALKKKHILDAVNAEGKTAVTDIR